VKRTLRAGKSSDSGRPTLVSQELGIGGFATHRSSESGQNRTLGAGFAERQRDN